MSTDHNEEPNQQISRDRETIRKWADTHNAVPVRESDADRGSESEEGWSRIVSEHKVSKDHERLEWEEFFEELDAGDHVVVYRGAEADQPFEIAGQGTIVEQAADEEIEQRLLDGETVTSTITETAVVKRVVVEEATIGSKLVDTRMINGELVDLTFLEREATDCHIVEAEDSDDSQWFDTERYFEAVADHHPISGIGDKTEAAGSPDGTGPTSPDSDPIRGESIDASTGSEEVNVPTRDVDQEPPFYVELNIEEQWLATRSFREEFVVESRVTDTEVTEADTIEEYDIDISGLHRSILESGILDAVADSGHADTMDHYEIDSELSEDDRITTTFTRERTVEDELLDRMRIIADVTVSESEGMEVVRTETVEDAEAAADDEMATADAPSEPVTTDENDVGKAVIDSTGEKLGIVSDVDAASNTLFGDTEPGVAARVKAAMGWGDIDEEDYRLPAEEISRITDDVVELQDFENLDEDEHNP